MKKIYLVFILLISQQVIAQIGPLAKSTRLDFAVSDHPAFTILDNKSDNILRPSNSQELFSFIYANFVSGTTPIIPKDFSLEFSPVQLIGINRITLEDYRKNGNRILYDLKLSIGAKTSDDGKKLNNFATGLRFTWIDNTSLSANQEFIDKALKGLKKEAYDESMFIDSLVAAGYVYNGTPITNFMVMNDSVLRNYIDENLYKSRRVSRVFSIKSLREQYKNQNWNKTKFETSMAMKFSSGDSLIAHSYYSKFQFFNTYAHNLGKFGQILIGVNYADTRKDSIHRVQRDSVRVITDTVSYHYSEFTLATRIYLGTNKFKAFIEGSGKYTTDKMMRLGINVGAELNVYDGIWASVNFGNNWARSTDTTLPDRKWSSDFYWSLDFRFKIPEKMNL
jgi:hypothetical protein